MSCVSCASLAATASDPPRTPHRGFFPFSLNHPFAAALARASSRLAPPPTPLASVAIHAAVLIAWVFLFVLAFSRGGVVAWSVGLAYIAYDTLLQGFVGWHTWRLLRPVVPTPSGGARCSVAVIVAAHDEAAVLPATIAALLAQTDPPDEIVIADDGSSDATAATLAQRYGLVSPPLGHSLRLMALPVQFHATCEAPER